MVKAIIFDLDGLIVDSEPIHFKAHQMALKKHGIKLSKKDYVLFGVAKGSKFLYETMASLHEKKSKQKVDLPISEVQKIKRTYFIDLIKTKLTLRANFNELITEFYGKYKLAIASTTKKEVIMEILKMFGLVKYFDVIVSGYEVKKNKPNPEVYIETAKRLNVAVKDCVAIEDSESGLIAAKKAGMKCIVVPNEFTQSQDFSKADLVLTSLNKLNLQIISAR